jgi:hypothetical protein
MRSKQKGGVQTKAWEWHNRLICQVPTVPIRVPAAAAKPQLLL